MKIFYWASDRGGCGYYRCQLPAGQLRILGHQVEVTDRAIPDEVRAGAVDVIVGQRLCRPDASSVWQKLARAGHSKLVLELDDDLWSLDPSNKAAMSFYPQYLGYLEANLRVADLVTVTTDVLAERVGEFNSNVVVLPNCVPAYLLYWAAPTPQELCTIGYTPGSSHSRDFGEVAAPLRRLLQKHPETLEFHCIGCDLTARAASIRGRTRHTQWQFNMDDYYRAIDFDVGIAPLRDTPFNRFKSDIKVLEYSALGIPTVASYVGPYQLPVLAGVADAPLTSKGWENALEMMDLDVERRVDMGKQAREWAADRTIEANAWKWAEAYEHG